MSRGGASGCFVLIACEHGGNRVPDEFRSWFEGCEAILAGHRGFDVGALPLARALASASSGTLLASEVSRLVVELNRSPHNPRLWSPMLRRAPPAVRQDAYERHYRPYRERGEHLVAAALARGERVVHVSSHSFTPILDGVVRNADIGLLYDPKRPAEVHFCAAWQAALRRHAPTLRVRRNYPYRGASDGFCTWMRRRFPHAPYVGIELEVNQARITGSATAWRQLQSALAATLREVLLRESCLLDSANANPEEKIMAHEQFQDCIEACNRCAAACDHCATACLAEADPKPMARCIALDLDCADICRLAAASMARDSEFVPAVCGLCALICENCAEECARHQHRHCQECAAACRRCAEACRRMAA